ncbi:hypothetical protein HQN60_14380 [Deefgea piscis]|uniref:Uncharacterized protein n=1 Tax=Deefgea piscis TaxID=2739061 RepID=A0A6M8SR97_9NEIS|nr:hypothetical protein [Deefgea piscis]QKJ67812.1 hypothetical protein HQN60_14380 [Deefgea piscis]
MHYTIVAPQPLQALLAHRLKHFAAIDYQFCDKTNAQSAMMFVQANPHAASNTFHADIELLALPALQAADHGFIFAAAGSITALQSAAPLLDALAPIANGWLHIGDFGAASFAHRAWQIMTGNPSQENPAFWQNIPSLPTPNPLNQAQFIAELAQQMGKQQQQCIALQQLANEFLSQQPAHDFQPYSPLQRQFFGPWSQTNTSPAQQLASFILQIPTQSTPSN